MGFGTLLTMHQNVQRPKKGIMLRSEKSSVLQAQKFVDWNANTFSFILKWSQEQI